MDIKNRSYGVGRGIKNTLPEGLYVNPIKSGIETNDKEIFPYGMSHGNAIRYNDDSFFYLEVALPGVKKEDILVGLVKEENINTLKVIYKRKCRILIESNFEEKILRFYLKNDLDLEKIDVSFIDGMLLVKIPRCIEPDFDKPLIIN